MRKTHVVVTCLGLNVLLIGYVSAPARREVDGRDSIRREMERATERAKSHVVFSSAQEREYARREETAQSRAAVAARIASRPVVESRKGTAPVISKNTQISPQLTASVRIATESLADRPSGVAAAFSAETPHHSQSNIPAVLSQYVPIAPRVSRAELPSVQTPGEDSPIQPLSPTAALAAEDGFEPFTAELHPQDPRGGMRPDSGKETAALANRQAGIVTLEDQQIRALYGVPAFHRNQKERVMQELQDLQETGD
jgi:hypothetical protein